MTLVTSGTGRAPAVARVSAAAFGRALGLQNMGQILEVGDAHGEAAFDGCFGHAVNHAGLLALRHREPPGRPDLAQAGCAVFSHTRHQYGHGLRTKLLGYAVEQYVDRRPVSVYRSV